MSLILPYQKINVVAAQVFALLEECTQLALSTRDFELWDIYCDLAGIVLFSWLALRMGPRKTVTNPE